MSDVAVIISTYGDKEEWQPLAERAASSANTQTVLPDEVYWVHEPGMNTSLGAVRNRGARAASSEFLIFLDADDTLDPFYVQRMLEADGDLRQPATLGVVDGIEDAHPVLIPPRNLIQANYIVIGAMCRADLFWYAGGFRDWPVLEDWDLWIRMALNGAEITHVPGAVYRVTVRPNSRNSQQDLHNRTYAAIQKQYYVEWVQKFGFPSGQS